MCLLPRLKAQVLLSDISTPTLGIGQIIKVLMLDIINSIFSACIHEFLAIRIKSFIVNFSLELVKFDISTCAFKRGIRVVVCGLLQDQPRPNLLALRKIPL